MRIDDVQLTSPDPQAYAAALIDLLDLPVPDRGTVPADGSTHIHAEGSVRLTCGASSLTVTPGPVGPGVHHLAFSVPNATFDDAHRWLAGHVDLMQVDGTDVFTGAAHWQSRSVYFFGPDRSILELIARRPLPDADLLRWAGARSLDDLPRSSVAGLSEVGVASPDLDGLRASLSAQGLQPFGTPIADFSPVGDHDGLLILVAPGRVWSPQDALVCDGGPLRVTVRTPGGTTTLTVAQDGTWTVQPPQV